MKPKICKPVNSKTRGYESCGKERNIYRYGLCTQCFYNWLTEDERGKIYNEKINSYKRKKSYIKPLSNKRKIENKNYLKLRMEFLSKKENKICPIMNKPTTDIHHKKGRIGNLLNDTRYWIALSREGHKFVEENPIWAKENGYSLNRLSND